MADLRDQCPGCGCSFASPENLLHHLNTTLCDYLANPDRVHTSVPPAFVRRPEENVTGQYHSKSGAIFGKGETLQDRLQKDPYEDRRKHTPYYPFTDEGEWELAKFLSTHLTQTQIDQFLKLKWFQTRPKPSFKSANQLCGWLDSLPSGPEWQCTTLTIEDCPTAHPIRLIWRDARAVVEELLSNPVFANHMTFDPHIVMRGTEREYSEFFTADRAHRLQDQLPKGATLVPIILASDKTPVTRHTGGLEMHPVFVTIANIQSDIRMQATSYAWRCVAFMPVPDFTVDPAYRTMLSARIFHQCMDIVFETLKEVALKGKAMSDALGNVRNCFTPLVAYIGDLPEQQLVSCVAKSGSPVTTATTLQFGDPFPHSRRSGADTLRQLQEICAETHPWNLRAFLKKAKEINLLGVHLPFWRNWRFADPGHFLNGEVLHSCHKFFFDHPLRWCIEVAGKHVLDSRYKAQHKRIGVRHFNSGISHIKQMTGREHRDIQRTIVPMMVKASPDVKPLFVFNLRCIIEFIYLAQNPVHTDASIHSMVDALRQFHETKEVVIESEARRGTKGVKEHFNIPKLEVMQSFARNIRDNGALLQYTADVTERLLITHCKDPFERTNRHGNTFTDQITVLLNREENIRRFDLYQLLRQSSQPLENIIVIEDEEITTVDPLASFVSRILPETERSFSGPRTFRDHFADPRGFLSSSGAVAFHVTIQPDCAGITVAEMQHRYPFPHATHYINQYFLSCGDLTPSWSHHSGIVDVWHKCRIQQRSSFRSRHLMRSQVIQASPRSEERPFGAYDAVMVGPTGAHNAIGVARVKTIFAPKVNPRTTHPPLAFVEFFTECGQPLTDQEGVGLYRVQRPPAGSHASEPSTLHAVVPLTDIMYMIELVPVFETAIPGIDPTMDSCLEAYEQYYVNSFADKETFNVIC